MRRENRWGSVEPNDADRVFRSLQWKKQLEDLDRHWVSRSPENEALWQNQKAACWQCVYAACMQYRGDYTYDERSDAVILIMQELEKYDPEKFHLQESGCSDSALVAYTLRLLRLKLRTAYKQGIDIEYDAVEEVNAEGETSHKGRIAASLNESVGEEKDEESTTHLDLLLDPEANRRENMIAKDAAAAVVFSFLAQVSHFDTYQKGQRRNESRRLHYDLCFTEQVTCFAAQGGFSRILDAGNGHFKAADIERALCRSYLNFFCHDVQGESLLCLENVRLKRRCDCFSNDIKEAERKERLEWKDSGFLEAKVPLCYLAEQRDIRTSNGEISRYRDDYITDVKGLVGKCGYDYTILSEIG